MRLIGLAVILALSASVLATAARTAVNAVTRPVVTERAADNRQHRNSRHRRVSTSFVRARA